ncbi:Glycerophosphodiester phosphodiesterase [Nymphaea thermarum]|nr:Glycerophosphodiester phosphodiesterase [Nymphaea thermarum]
MEFSRLSYSEITSYAYFHYIKQYVVGIGPWKDTIVPPIENHPTTATDLVAKAHAHDLQVHPYTYTNEYVSPLQLPSGPLCRV